MSLFVQTFIYQAPDEFGGLDAGLLGQRGQPLDG